MASYPGNPVVAQGRAISVGYYWNNGTLGQVYSLYLGILQPIIVSHPGDGRSCNSSDILSPRHK
jgi:hypothetical protein